MECVLFVQSYCFYQINSYQLGGKLQCLLVYFSYIHHQLFQSSLISHMKHKRVPQGDGLIIIG